MPVHRFYVHTVTSLSRPFHEAPAFELDTVEHPLHLCYFIIQFIGGNAATEYNNLLKNIGGMKTLPYTFNVCPHRSVKFSYEFIIYSYLTILTELLGYKLSFLTIDTTMSVGTCV